MNMIKSIYVYMKDIYIYNICTVFRFRYRYTHYMIQHLSILCFLDTKFCWMKFHVIHVTFLRHDSAIRYNINWQHRLLKIVAMRKAEVPLANIRCPKKTSRAIFPVFLMNYPNLRIMGSQNCWGLEIQKNPAIQSQTTLFQRGQWFLG